MSQQVYPGASTRSEAETQHIISMVQTGKDALEKGDLDTALNHFETVVAQFPDRAEGHNNLGGLFAALGRFEKADACFSRVLEIVPGNCNVHYNRGIVLIRLQRYDDAIEDFTKVLESYPDDADCLNNLGVAHFLKSELATARDYFQRTLALAPGFVNAVLNLCDTEAADDRAQDAISLCEEHLEHTADSEIRHKLLELQASEARAYLSKACLTAEAILRCASDDIETRTELGRLLEAKTVLDSAATPR